MKFLILFICGIAACSAGVIKPVHYLHHQVPTVDAHGVPQDTVEVQQAKVAHFAAKSEALARNGDYVQAVPVVATSTIPVVPQVNTQHGHIVSQHVPVVSHVNTQYVPVVSHVNTQHIPVVSHTNTQHVPLIPNGVPVETAEVQQAKAVHYAHKIEAQVRNGDYAYQTYGAPVVATPVVSQPAWTGEQHVPVINEQGVPEETVEVKQAKADHLATVKYATPVATTYVRNSPVVAPVEAPVDTQLAWTGEQHVPVINQNGVPEETVEVKQAKAEHFAVVQEATTEDKKYPVVAQNVWTGEQHVPVITEQGVPEETIEVKQAKADHFATVKYAAPVDTTYVHDTPVVASVVAPVAPQPSWTGEQHVPVINQYGVPEETVEVQQAKANHFAATVQAVKPTTYVQNTPVVASVQTPVVAQNVWTGEQHVPVINQNGVPEETVEVKQAKADHFATVKYTAPTAYIRNSASIVAPSVAQPVWTGEQHVPVLNEHGVPDETVEVKQAKADHFAAVKDAEVQEDSVVTETPDVVAAKGEQLAAHFQASARSAPVDAYYTQYVAPVNQYYGNYGYSTPYVHYY